jgi:hypothetical protein
LCKHSLSIFIQWGIDHEGYEGRALRHPSFSPRVQVSLLPAGRTRCSHGSRVISWSFLARSLGVASSWLRALLYVLVNNPKRHRINGVNVNLNVISVDLRHVQAGQRHGLLVRVQTQHDAKHNSTETTGRGAWTDSTRPRTLRIHVGHFSSSTFTTLPNSSGLIT